MEIESLRSFVALANTLSFTAAAKELCVVQSTLSRRISALEKELGTPLVTRSTTDVALTSEGRMFFETAEKIIELYDAGIKSIRESRRQSRSVVKVGGMLNEVRVHSVLTATIGMLKRQNASVDPEPYQLHMSESFKVLLSNDATEAALSGKVDVSLLPLCSEFENGLLEDFDRRFLFNVPLGYLGSEENPIMANGKPAPLEALRDHTFVCAPFWTAMTTRIVDVCREAGFEPHVSIRHFESMGEMLTDKNVHEVYCVPRPYRGQASLLGSGLDYLPIQEENAYLAFYAFWKRDNPNPGIVPLVDALEEVSHLLDEREDFVL